MMKKEINPAELDFLLRFPVAQNAACPGVHFINVICTAFALVDPESVKNTVKSSVSLYAFGIYERKSCT